MVTGWKSSVRAVAVTVRSPGSLAVMVGTSPVAVTTASPAGGRGTEGAPSCHRAVTSAPFCATRVVSRMLAPVVAACSAVSSATADAGSVTRVATSAGRIATPGAARSGNLAATRTDTDRVPPGNAQV